MESVDFNSLSPLIILALAPVVSLLAISIHRNYRLIFLLAVISMLVFLVSLTHSWLNYQVTGIVADQLVMDKFSLFYLMLLGAASLVLLFISYPYLQQHTEVREEYYLLLQTSVFGAAILVCSVHFATLFLGLEILSVSLYTMIAYTRQWDRSLEGGLKYLILAAASSAFLLFGMALIYNETGHLSFSELAGSANAMGVFSTVGVAMMLVGVGFKLALVPFHTWTPDIYQGAPAPVSALIASISKGSVVAVLIRFIEATQSQHLEWFVWVLSIMAVASMLAGSILALQQRNLKRLLAYSSIAHLGYILIAIIAGTDLSTEAVTFYLVAYFISIIGAFGTLSVFSSQGEIEEVQDLQGMFWTRPLVSVVFSIMFFSMVGIPLTAGFMGKFYVVLAAVDTGLWFLAIVLIISSIIGLYYYLRVIKTMLSPVEQTPVKTADGKVSLMGMSAVTILGVLIILLGVVPSQLIAMIRAIGAVF